MGHSSLKTTLESYFHRQDELQRLMLDQVWQERRCTSKVAAYWTGRTAAAIRKQWQRNPLSRHTVLQDLRSIAFPATADHFSFPEDALTTGRPCSLAGVRKVVSDIGQGVPLSVVALRAGLAEKSLNTVVAQAIATTNKLLTFGGQYRRTIPDGRMGQHVALEWLAASLQHLHIEVTLDDEPSWSPLMKKLNKAATLTPADVGAIEHWMRAKQRNGVALVPGQGTHHFLMWLSASGLSGDALLIRVPYRACQYAGASRLTEMAADAQAIHNEALRHFHGGVRIEAVRSRRHQDQPYIVVARSPISAVAESAPAAQVRMARFHGLMFCLAVWSSMSEENA